LRTTCMHINGGQHGAEEKARSKPKLEAWALRLRWIDVQGVLWITDGSMEIINTVGET
jgi:hypothetical protein